MVQLLVDNQSPNKKFAFTTDAEKIANNRNLLRSVPFANSIKIPGLNGGNISMFSVGRYITVVQIASDGIPKKMYFFDYDWEISTTELQILLQGIFSSELAKEWFNIQWSLYQFYKNGTDSIELFKP